MLRRERLAVLAGAVCIGAVLVMFAVPRLAAGILEGPFDETMRELARNESLTNTQLDLAIANRERALDWFDNARSWADLGALNYARWRQTPAADAGRSDYLHASIAADRAAVARLPALSFVWFHLVRSLLARDGYEADISSYLTMSYRTAPAEPRLILPRLDLALAIWPRLDDTAQQHTGQQIALAMRWFPEELVDLTRRRFALARVRAGLAAYPELRARFNILYLSRR